MRSCGSWPRCRPGGSAQDWDQNEATLDPTRVLGPGSVVSHYRIEAQVGVGSFAAVFRARDTKLDRTVALKVLKPGSPGVAADDAGRGPAGGVAEPPERLHGLRRRRQRGGAGHRHGVPARPPAQRADGGRCPRPGGGGRDRPPGRRGDGRRACAGDRARRPEAAERHGDRRGSGQGPRLRPVARIEDVPVDQQATVAFSAPEQGTGLYGTPGYMAPEQTRGCRPARPATSSPWA